MDKPIFILGAHKSGTTLLRSLFDGHNEVFSVPIETHFFQLMRYWINYAFLTKSAPRLIDRDEFVDHAKGCIRYSNKEENPKSDGVSKGIFNLQYFDDYLASNLNVDLTAKNYLSIYFESYMKAIYYSINGCELEESKRIVEKSVETAELALDLQQMFPDAYFIHIIRNPYANLVSMKNFRMYNKRTNRYPWLGYDYRSLYNSYYFLYRNRRLISKYKIVRYEDLVTDPKSVIKSICKFTELEFLNTMLTPTYLGKTWGGNSTSSQGFQGISPSRMNRWKETINSLESKIINKYLKHIVEEFNYEVFDTGKSIFLPSKKELPAEYIANRFLWAFG